MSERKFAQHWPAMVLGLIVAVIFIAALVVFEVEQTEIAVLETFGKPETERADGTGPVRRYAPGLHLKWPLIQTVWRHDNRLQCYELKQGQVEQIQTQDQNQVVVTTFVLWRVSDPGIFLRAVITTEQAESNLDNLVRNARNSVLAQYKLTELINSTPGAVKIPEIEKQILADINEVAKTKYGIEVAAVEFKYIGFPELVTAKVFQRMQEERKRKAESYRADGRRDAQKIRSEADLKASQTLSEAEAAAKRIRADGDKAAAEHYAVFSQNPQLAAFLRKLDSLRATLSEKTTLVLDTQTPPYDLLLPGATRLEGAPKPVAPEGK